MLIRNHFIYMLVALLIFLVVIPIVGDYTNLSSEILRATSYSCLLLVGVWSLRESNRVFRLAVVIAITGFVTNVLTISPTQGDYVSSSSVLMFLFLLLAIWASLKQVLFSNEISLNRVFGVVCVYLLLGSIWAVTYSFVEHHSPGSFTGSGLENVVSQETEWTYFSFVTLTTLGYGDITPVTNTARVLVYAEAIFGVFYMAILVASMVSAYTNVRLEEDSNSSQ